MKRYLCLLILVSHSTFAADTFFSTYLSFLRPTIGSLLGEERARALYGETPATTVQVEEAIKMPPIPQPKKQSTSTESVSLGLNPKSKYRFLTPTQLNQLHFDFIHDVYLAVKKVKPSEDETAKWMNALSQGGSREGVYRALVLDAGYANLESINSPVNKNMTDFTIKHMEKFLAQKVKAENVAALNTFTLKRIITEKTLEVFDELKKQPEDFYNWYALLAAELAKDHGQFLKGKVAREIEPKVHKLWAKEMPEQVLKGEVILRLHMVYNGLM